MQNKISILEEQLEQIRAYIDQRIDQLQSDIDELSSRINNLR